MENSQKKYMAKGSIPWTNSCFPKLGIACGEREGEAVREEACCYLSTAFSGIAFHCSVRTSVSDKHEPRERAAVGSSVHTRVGGKEGHEKRERRRLKPNEEEGGKWKAFLCFSL